EMWDHTVLLSQDVYELFQAFCSPKYAQLRAEREPLISNNLRQLLELVSESLSQQEDAMQRSKDARLEGRNEQCEAAIRSLLTRLEGCAMVAVIAMRETRGRDYGRRRSTMLLAARYSE